MTLRDRQPRPGQTGFRGRGPWISTNMRRDMAAIAAHFPPGGGDQADHEIEAAIEEGRPVRLEDAYPRLPNPARVAADAEVRGASVSERIEQIAIASPSYSREYQLQLLHKLMLRGLPLDTVAPMMGISLNTVVTLRRQLMNRLREEAKYIDIHLLAGKSRAFYEEIKHTAMRIASDTTRTDNAPNVTPRTRLEALRVASMAEDSFHRFLTVSGFFNNAHFSPSERDEDGGQDGQVSTLLNMISYVIDPDTNEEVGFRLETVNEAGEDVTLIWPAG